MDFNELLHIERTQGRNPLCPLIAKLRGLCIRGIQILASPLKLRYSAACDKQATIVKKSRLCRMLPHLRCWDNSEHRSQTAAAVSRVIHVRQ